MCSALALSFAAPMLPAMSGSAHAQGFFQRLFNPEARRQQQQPDNEQRLERLQQAVKSSYVAAPKYFTYKPDRLSAVDLVSLSKVTRAEAVATPAPEAPVSDAVAPDADAAAQVDGQSATDQVQPTVQPAPVQLTAFDKARPALADMKLSALKEVGDALLTFYRDHPDFVWVENGEVSAKAKEVLGGLKSADAYALDPEDYRVSEPMLSGLDDEAREKALMEFEMSMSAAVLTYVLDAERGRVDPNRISEYHDLPRHKVDLVAALKGFIAPENALSELVSHQPDSEQFQTLTSELAELRAQDKDADPIVIEPGTFLKPGKSSPEMKNIVAAIRKNGSKELLDTHADTILTYADGEEYTPELVSLVKGFQKENKLSADGVVGKNTIIALVGETNAAKISKVELAMERLRWLPKHLGPRRVFINQPAFTATYYEPGKDPLSMRVVVGQKAHQTNFFYDTIETVEYNPYWGVPYSIIVNEMLPKLAKDPSYLDHAGYEVSTVNGRQVASSSVNWVAVASKQASVNVRQYPGPSNALGQLKILFPNKHHIYMHDTPAKSLFKRDMRAYSHGCVRLQDPQAMAAAVLGKTKSYVGERISEGRNEQERVAGNIPVYVSYFTAWPGDDGKVAFFNDVYDRDRKLIEAIDATDKVRG